MEVIAQIFGMTFVCIIMVCVAWTIVEYIITENEFPKRRKYK